MEMNRGENVAITSQNRRNEKILTKKGLPEIMARALNNIDVKVWVAFPMTGRNSGFKKQYYKRIKAKRLQIKHQAREQGYWTPEMTRDHQILNIAYDNDDAVLITFALMSGFHIRTPQDQYPDLTYQGVVNWVALEGTDNQRKNLARYITALSIFNLREKSGNLYGK